MLAGIIIVIFCAVAAVICYVLRSSRKAEKQKYYDAAYKIVKENCLNSAIRNQDVQAEGGQKLMLYLTWKDQKKQGYVFDPEQPVRIGRSPEVNNICIREETVSEQHCVLFLYQGQLLLQDMNSRNGTWLKQGFKKRQVRRAEPVFTGDKIIVGNLKIKVTVFLFDMAYV